MNEFFKDIYQTQINLTCLVVYGLHASWTALTLPISGLMYQTRHVTHLAEIPKLKLTRFNYVAQQPTWFSLFPSVM